MIVKLCTRCKKVIQYNETYCSKCKLIVLEEKQDNKIRTNTKYNKQRNKKYEQFYNSKEWRQLSKQYLLEHDYKCEDCKEESTNQYGADIATATECHHMQPIQTQEGWILRLDRRNLRALCRNHHNLRHDRFANKTNRVNDKT